MSHIYLSALVNVLVAILAAAGIEIGSEELTQAIQTLIAVGTGLYIMFRRVQAGDISLAGTRRF